MTGFGFPLSWYAASATTSNASKVALVPLAVDLLVYALAVMLLQWLVADRLMRGLHLSSRALKMIGVALWVAAALCAAAAAVIMTPNLRVDVMTVDDYFNGEGIIRQRSPVLGFLPQER